MGATSEDAVTASSPHNRQIRGPVAIIGVGLIGGSIAAAVRSRAKDVDVIGVGRSADRLQKAVDAGLLTRFATSPDEIGDAWIVIGCTPVDRLAHDLLEAARAVDANCVLTDGGSVKAPLCEKLAGLPHFVGAHPLAGSEKTGWENASADLYDDKLCVITPGPKSQSDAVDHVTEFWQAIGMRTISMTPEQHDAAVAQTSHLPHLAAAAVARMLEVQNQPLVAAGFRDTTRVAAGDPAMWTAIVEANQQAVSEQLGRLIDDLQKLQGLVDNSDLGAIQTWLQEAAAIRSSLHFG